METIGGNNWHEKRKYPRDDYSLPFHYETRGTEHTGFMRNVGIGGALISTNMPIKIEQEFHLISFCLQ